MSLSYEPTKCGVCKHWDTMDTEVAQVCGNLKTLSKILQNRNFVMYVHGGQCEEGGKMEVRIRKARGQNDHDLLVKMLDEYIRELHDMDANVEIRPEGKIRRDFLWLRDTLYWLIMADKEVAGFCILGHRENCHPQADGYVEEFYIRPDYRRKGIGFAGAKMILDGKSRVCLDIMQKNLVAKAFWDRVFDGWTEKHVKDIREDVPYADFYFYEK